MTIIGDGHTAFDQLAENALSDVFSFWKTNYPRLSGGKALPALKGGIYSVDDLHVDPAVRANACLTPDPSYVDNNAFYCSDDDSIAYDRIGFIPQLESSFGPYIVDLLFAHEFAHAIQARLGIDPTLTIDKESQADCAAGAFTASVLDFHTAHARISASELDKVLVGYIQLRDPANTPSTTLGSHGDGFDRLGALSDGIRYGVTYCYSANWDQRTFTERPFTTDADYATGGNEPEAEVLNPSATGGGLQPSLNAFWAASAKSIGKSWQNVKIVQGLPPCLRQTISQFNYCPADNTVYYSKKIADDAYKYGDYALGTLFVYGWGSAVRHQLFGRTATDSAGLLAVGCYAGAYSRSVNVSTGTGFVLSPPDMDEATIAVLTMVGDPLTYGALGTTGLDRIQSFKTGYTGGLASC